MTARRVDFAAVRAARAELARLVRAHPQLTTPTARARLGAALEQAMPRKRNPEGSTHQTAIRLETSLVERLDAVAAKLTRPGLDVTRSDAIRIALATGLEQLERELADAKRGGRK